MSKHLDDPVKGVEKLIDYMESHGVELAAAEADLVFSISQIEKDGDRAERIKEVQDELKTVRENLNGTSKKFFKAVMADEKAADQFKGFEERMRDARKVRFGSGFGLF